MGGYGDYDGYNNGYGNGYGGNEGQMMPMNGGASQEWRMPPMPAAPQMPGQNQLPPGPPMGRMQFGDEPPPSRGGPRSRGAPAARLVMTTRSMAVTVGGSQYGGSQYGGWRRDPYGQDGDDGGRR